MLRVVNIWIFVVILLLFAGNKLASNLANNVATVLLVRNENYRVPNECGVLGGNSEIENAVNHAIALDRNNGNAWRSLGRIDWLVGNCDEAIKDWQQSLELEPDNIITALYLGDALSYLNRTSESADVFSRISASKLLFLRCITREQNIHISEDIDWCELSFAVEPKKDIALRLVDKYLSEGRKDDAITVLETLLMSPSLLEYDSWWAQGKLAEIKGDWDGAATAYTKASDFAQEPYLFSLLLSAANAEFQLKHYDQSLMLYNRASSLRPNDNKPLIGKGLIYYALGQMEEAETFFEQSKVIDPTEVLAWYYLAQIAAHNQQFDIAIENLNRALSFRNTRPEDWLNFLGDWYIAIGDCEQAQLLYEEIIELSPNRQDIIDKLSLIGQQCK